MSVTISIILSILALLVAIGQWRVQRVHNEKSVKPLVQIDLPDHKKKLAVHIRNNGLGPFIINRITYLKEGTIFNSLEECIDLNPRFYMHISADASIKRVILPNAHLAIFEKNFGDQADEADIDLVREQLSSLTLQVEGQDIYDNKIAVRRDFRWFARHILAAATEESISNLK